MLPVLASASLSLKQLREQEACLARVGEAHHPKLSMLNLHCRLLVIEFAPIYAGPAGAIACIQASPVAASGTATRSTALQGQVCACRRAELTCGSQALVMLTGQGRTPCDVSALAQEALYDPVEAAALHASTMRYWGHANLAFTSSTGQGMAVHNEHMTANQAQHVPCNAEASCSPCQGHARQCTAP